MLTLDCYRCQKIQGKCKEHREQKVYVLKRSPIKRKQQQRGHKFSPPVRKEIFDRDGKCINPLCPKLPWMPYDPHHVYWRSFERIHDFEAANKVTQGVQLCRWCHESIPTNHVLDAYCHTYLLHLYPPSL